MAAGTCRWTLHQEHQSAEIAGSRSSSYNGRVYRPAFAADAMHEVRLPALPGLCKGDMRPKKRISIAVHQVADLQFRRWLDCFIKQKKHSLTIVSGIRVDTSLEFKRETCIGLYALYRALSNRCHHRNDKTHAQCSD